MTGIGIIGGSKKLLSTLKGLSGTKIITSRLTSYGKTKNKLLKQLKDYEDIFLIEDCVDIIDDDVFEYFIDTRKKTGFECLMWGKAFPGNKKLKYDDSLVEYYTDFATPFSYYTDKVIKTVGYMDEKMPPNTWEEYEHVKRIGDMGFAPPFGIFVSPKFASNYLEVNEKIKDKYSDIDPVKMKKGLEYWTKKDGDEFSEMLYNKMTKKNKLMDMKPAKVIL